MGDKARDPRASVLSPIHIVFGHGLCNLCHYRIQLFWQPRQNLYPLQYKALAVPLICPRKVTNNIYIQWNLLIKDKLVHEHLSTLSFMGVLSKRLLILYCIGNIDIFYV